MKKLITLTALSTVLFAPMSFADLAGDLQNICTIVKNNDKGELRKKMRSVKSDYNLRLGDYYDGITCGGNSLIRYSMENGANDVGAYLVKRMSKTDLTKSEQDGQSLQQWASANGYMDSEIGQELVDRLN